MEKCLQTGTVKVLHNLHVIRTGNFKSRWELKKKMKAWVSEFENRHGLFQFSVTFKENV